ERELVLARQHIDKEAREGVVAPGTPNLARLFVDREVDAGALQRLGHEQAGDAPARNDDAKSRINHGAPPTAHLGSSAAFRSELIMVRADQRGAETWRTSASSSSGPARSAVTPAGTSRITGSTSPWSTPGPSMSRRSAETGWRSKASLRMNSCSPGRRPCT